MSVEGFQRVISKLKKLSDLAALAKGKSVVVGYAAPYAVYVHENLEAIHTNGQAQFLSRAMKELGSEVARRAIKNGASVIDALELQGMAIQALSQTYCPVLTGNLRGSAFTEVRSDG